MTRIEVPSETLVVEMGEDGLNIVETFMQMSGMDDSAHVICDICSTWISAHLVTMNRKKPFENRILSGLPILNFQTEIFI